MFVLLFNQLIHVCDTSLVFFFPGVGGNLVAVQASRISTSLHRVSVLGKLPPGVRYGCIHSFCTAGKFIRFTPNFVSVVLYLQSFLEYL